MSRISKAEKWKLNTATSCHDGGTIRMWVRSPPTQGADSIPPTLYLGRPLFSSTQHFPHAQVGSPLSSQPFEEMSPGLLAVTRWGLHPSCLPGGLTNRFSRSQEYLFLKSCDKLKEGFAFFTPPSRKRQSAGMLLYTSDAVLSYPPLSRQSCLQQ